jgi:effector-binding domain-containing protein
MDHSRRSYRIRRHPAMRLPMFHLTIRVSASSVASNAATRRNERTIRAMPDLGYALSRKLAAAIVALFAAGGLASAQQAPALPPPGSLSTPPAAPNPLKPAEAPGAQQTPSDQMKTPDISGPTDAMLTARPALVLKGQSTWDDGYDNLMEAFQKLQAEAKRLKLDVVGRPQTVFLATDDFGFRYEAMVVLTAEPATPIPSLGKDFSFGKTPAGKALKFTHLGAYDDIDTTYEAITAYLDEKGLKSRDIFVEEYMTDPKSSEDVALEMNIYVLIE